MATTNSTTGNQIVELAAGTAAAGSFTLAAGSAIVGKVGIDQTTPGTTDRVTVGGMVYPTSTPVLSVAGSYSTGDYIGTTTTPQAFAGVVRTTAGSAVLQSITIIDKTVAAAPVALELWLLSATFVAPTDNAAWAITDAESLTTVAVIPITTDKWYASANNRVYSDTNLGRIVTCAATSLFYALVARGTTPTWASGDLQMALGLIQN